MTSSDFASVRGQLEVMNASFPSDSVDDALVSLNRLEEQLETRQALINEVWAWFQGLASYSDNTLVFDLAERLEAAVSSPATSSERGVLTGEDAVVASSSASRSGVSSPATEPDPKLVDVFRSMRASGHIVPVGAERCPVCEGLDQPGLIHNSAAPYCSQASDPASSPITVQWLIERGQPEGFTSAVWLENSGNHPATHRQWTNVARNAAMFPDRETAEAYIAAEGLPGRAVEHGFTSDPASGPMASDVFDPPVEFPAISHETPEDRGWAARWEFDQENEWTPGNANRPAQSPASEPEAS